MDIEEYCRRKRITIREFSDAANYTYEYIRLIAKKKRTPSPHFSKRMFDLTGGCIDLSNYITPKKGRRRVTLGPILEDEEFQEYEYEIETPSSLE